MKESLIKVINRFFSVNSNLEILHNNDLIEHRKRREMHQFWKNRLVSALKLKWTQIHAGISIVHTLSSTFFELCSPMNGCSVKVPPLYFSIFVPLYIESLYSHTVQ